MPLIKAVDLAHIMLSEHLNEVSYVVDATCGNGFDSQHIASILGKNGKLFCFDIQEQAIINTQKRLLNISCNLTIFQCSHNKLKNKLYDFHNKIDAIIFNLGFLPQSENKLTTMTASTIDAVSQAISILRKKGLLLIITYPGHAEGTVENTALIEFLQNLSTIQIHSYKNMQNSSSPVLYAIIKK